MDNPVIFTLLIRGIISIGLLFGAILALRYGFRLFKDGAGLGSSHIVAEYGDFRVRANSIGAAVMVTAVGWAALVVWSAPKYSDDSGVAIEIASAGGMSIDAGSIDGYAEVAQLFRNALGRPENSLQLNGEPASVDQENMSQQVSFASSGNYLIGATVENAKGDSVFTVFEAEPENESRVRFRPVAVSEIEGNNNVAELIVDDLGIEGTRKEG